MHDRDTHPPPYPLPGTTVGQLHNALRLLAIWVDEEHLLLRQRADRRLIDNLPPCPPVAAYLSRPIPLFYAHLLYVRRIREAWDLLRRHLGDSWSSATATRCRGSLLQHAATFLTSAFAPSAEVVEATSQRTLRDLDNAFESLRDGLAQTLRPFEIAEDLPSGTGEGLL